MKAWMIFNIETGNAIDLVYDEQLAHEWNQQEFATAIEFEEENPCTPECCPPGMCCDGNDEPS